VAKEQEKAKLWTRKDFLAAKKAEAAKRAKQG